MGDLQVKENTLIMARNSVNQTIDTEDISPATDHFSSSTGDLSSPKVMGRREAITTRAQAIECSSECHPGPTKGTFQQLNHEISDEVNGAEVDIEQRQQSLEKAGHIANGPNCMRHANEALAGGQSGAQPAGSNAPRSLAPAPPSAPAQSGGIKAGTRFTGSTITSTGKQQRQPATSNQGLSPSTITPSGSIVYANFVSTGNPPRPRAQQTPQADVSPNNRSLEEQYHLFFQKPSRAAVLKIHQSSKTRLRISAVPIQDVT
ncbi:hypothetical protein FOVSG1_010521 [Fusarium oxysporum f. sp. vasinfectum]